MLLVKSVHTLLKTTKTIVFKSFYGTFGMVICSCLCLTNRDSDIFFSFTLNQKKIRIYTDQHRSSTVYYYTVSTTPNAMCLVLNVLLETFVESKKNPEVRQDITLWIWVGRQMLKFQFNQPPFHHKVIMLKQDCTSIQPIT